jgi:2,4-dienoyl-CoA reductase-like NADH-dependent reductase (Old Yellow Enzyme family)
MMSKLFSSINIRGMEIKNRVFVSPMCQYSAEDNNGKPTDWHIVHLGSRAIGGAGLVMFEATAVSPEGRITPRDLGLWSDDQIDAFSIIANFIQSHGAVPAIQLAHAGRKASHNVPWKGNATLTTDEDGWEVVAPSSIPYDKNSLIPHELTIEEIHNITKYFADSAVRAITANLKIIELHFAHGYLVCEFLSPLTNKRSDIYGGSFENRIRLPLEIVDAVRNSIPSSIPLFVRLSSTEYMDMGWTIEDSVLLAGELKDHGVDLIDCSTGGNSPDQKIKPHPGYQVQFSDQIRAGANMKTGAVGLITEPSQANDILENGQADVIFMGRELLRNPYWPLYAEHYLDKSVDSWQKQYLRAIPDSNLSFWLGAKN